MRAKARASDEPPAKKADEGWLGIPGAHKPPDPLVIDWWSCFWYAIPAVMALGALGISVGYLVFR